MRSVLITGATTPVGRALVSGFLDDPTVAHVLAVDEGSKYPDPPQSRGRLTYQRVDLAKERELRDLLFGAAKILEVDTIVHSATKPREIEGTRELLRLAERHPSVRRFVFRSSSDVYRMRSEFPAILSEDHPLELSPSAPRWLRYRVEADLAVSTQMGISPLVITVLRLAECLVAGSGSQLYDYLASKICVTSLGYDPMVNLISLEDLVLAVRLAVEAGAPGIFNIPGKDTLPLSELIARSSARAIPLPSVLLAPVSLLRGSLGRAGLRGDMSYWRYHLSSVLDGRRARDRLGYVPGSWTVWPPAG